MEQNEAAIVTKKESGFTLIEVLIVVTVIGVLLGIVVVSVMNAYERAKQRATMADMRTISKALEVYATDTGHYPASGNTMPELVAILTGVQSTVVPTQDQWKHDFVYQTDDAGTYSIESYGKDGVDGDQIDYANRFSYELDMVVSNGLFTASPEP